MSDDKKQDDKFVFNEESWLAMHTAVHSHPPQLSLPSHRENQMSTESDISYTESLRKAVEDAKGSADHRALVIADLTRKLQAANKQLEDIELVKICAQDIVAAWPNMTLRTLSEMTKRIDTLRQALEAAK